MSNILYLLYLACLCGFFLLPPCLLLVKYFSPKLPWWVVLSGIALLGWGLVLAAVIFYYDALYDKILAYQAQGLQAPKDLLETWAADGAKKVFALLFGWLYALLYCLPWLLLYGMFSYRNNRQNHTRNL